VELRRGHLQPDGVREDAGGLVGGQGRLLRLDHHYELAVRWTGDRGQGTAAYDAYDRDYEASAPGKPLLYASADPHFRGGADRYNPEELLVAALSGCHLLSYLHLCADAGVTVVGYEDRPGGLMTIGPGGVGRFVEVTLRPLVTILEPEATEAALALHPEAHHRCYIASSVNFPVRCEAEVAVSTR
jgi:organic hydroperoxide reductase OsmC/OhrA